MTLILTVNGPETIWMLADRRLSYHPPKRPKDDARKFMFLETTDGVAMVGYAGLGETEDGTEPSDWMSAVLRGPHYPLEQSLDRLATAARRQLPNHVRGIAAAHCFVIPTFLNGKARLYTITIEFAPDRKTHTLRWNWVQGKRPDRTPRLYVAGSGATYIAHDRSWMRKLLKLVDASDAGRVSPHAVADYLAKINQVAHANTVDPILGHTVGEQCTVGWRHNKFGVHKGEGGGLQFYDRTQRADESCRIPMIVTGIDIQALGRAEMPIFLSHLSAKKDGEPLSALEQEKLKEALRKVEVPEDPDENLK